MKMGEMYALVEADVDIGIRVLRRKTGQEYQTFGSLDDARKNREKEHPEGYRIIRVTLDDVT